jgi:hypothetical protein
MNAHPLKALLAVTTMAATFNPAWSQTYVQTVLADHPEAYWRLGESSGSQALDTSGNGFTATYQTGVILGQAGAIQGDSNTSAYFSAATINSGVSIIPPQPVDPYTNTLQPVWDSWSVEAWIKTPAANVERTVLSWNCALSVGANNSAYSLTIDDGGLLWWTLSDEAANVAAIYGGVVTDDQWHHVVGVRDRTAGQSRLFVDGQMVVEWSFIGSSINESAGENVPLFIGTRGIHEDGTGLSPFEGRIDEVALYRSALSGVQVLNHYDVGVGAIPEPSTYAVLAGLAALAFAAVKRRISAVDSTMLKT